MYCLLLTCNTFHPLRQRRRPYVSSLAEVKVQMGVFGLRSTDFAFSARSVRLVPPMERVSPRRDVLAA
jgi:hypothetical protein